MTRKTYVGRDIDVSFDGKLCIHARECVTGLPGVFEANAPGPWIHPDEASVERIVAVAESCPSGAIAYTRRDGGPQETPPEVNTIRIKENGPLAFHDDELAVKSPANPADRQSPAGDAATTPPVTHGGLERSARVARDRLFATDDLDGKTEREDLESVLDALGADLLSRGWSPL